jgi:hypothetical protein
VLEPYEESMDIRIVEAIPGGPGPVLAIRKVPPFVCDAIVVKSPTKLDAAIDIIRGDLVELVAAGDILGRMLGTDEVSELPPESVQAEAQQKVQFR